VGADVVAAAAKLKVPLTEHSAVLAKVTAALKKIDSGIDWARRTDLTSRVFGE
jgi:hypothetical protein